MLQQIVGIAHKLKIEQIIAERVHGYNENVCKSIGTEHKMKMQGK